MGLFIGNEQTPVTVTSKENFTTVTGYVNIGEYYKHKDVDLLRVSFNIYKSKTDKTNGALSLRCADCDTVQQLPCTTQELAASDIFTVAYAKLKTFLETIYGEGNIHDDI